MTLKEIYNEINEHMINGLMLHDQLANYYDFLGLEGYKRCHEYHYFKENMSYRSLNRYFINHHNMLIPEAKFNNESIIPESWYNHERSDVDSATKKNAVKTGLEAWVKWERETKDLYERMYNELLDIDEIASACKVKCLIKDVDKELKKAERYWLNKEAINYDIGAIIAEQRSKHNKYKHKMEKCLRMHLC